MNRPCALLVLVVLLAGCRTPPPGDPFLLGRSTIPPPGTGAIGQPGTQASLAPPTVTMPQQNLPAAAPPTINTVPVAPTPPSMNAPPVNTPYNFHQGSIQKSPPETVAGDWTPTRQTTTNRAEASTAPATTVTAAKATASSAAAEATDMDAAADSTQSTLKVTSFQEASERISLTTDSTKTATAGSDAKSTSTKNLPEPNRFVPSGTVIRIVEPGAKTDGDSAARGQPDTSMTASSFQPQWQKWTAGATE